MWKINDFNAHWCKLFFKFIPLRCPFPIIPDKHLIKMILLPGSKFILIWLRNNLIYVTNCPNNSRTFFIWNNRCFMFVMLDKLVCTNTNN